MNNSFKVLYFHFKLCLRLKNVSVFQGPFDVGNMILSFEGVTQIMMALAQSDRSMHQVSCLTLIVSCDLSLGKLVFILYLYCVVQVFFCFMLFLNIWFIKHVLMLTLEIQKCVVVPLCAISKPAQLTFIQITWLYTITNVQLKSVHISNNVILVKIVLL